MRQPWCFGSIEIPLQNPEVPLPGLDLTKYFHCTATSYSRWRGLKGKKKRVYINGNDRFKEIEIAIISKM